MVIEDDKKSELDASEMSSAVDSPLLLDKTFTVKFSISLSNSTR